MVSSLATQLSKGVSLNASLLVDRSRRKRTESYLFVSREADQHDLHSIYALGVTGLAKLKILDPKFVKYEENLFSVASCDLDRTLQSVSQNAQLDHTLGSCLRDLGPYLLESPAAKALEWLVRRFRVNEFNLDDIMASFLPYHDTPHFAKMVSIMHVAESTLWSFLMPIKAAGKHLPHSILVDEMLKSVELARFVTELLPDSLKAGRTHRTLVCFSASILADYLTRMKRVNEEIIAFILSAITRSFASHSNPDCALAGYLTLATLSQRYNFSSKALVALLAEMIKGQRHIKSQQLFPLLIAVIEPQEELHQFSDSLASSILRLPDVIDAILDCLQWIGAEKLVAPLLPSLVCRASEEVCFDLLASILNHSRTSNSIIERHTRLCMDSILKSDSPDHALLHLLSIARQRHGTVFSQTYMQLLKVEENVKDRRALEAMLRSIVLPSSFTVDNRGTWILSSKDVDVNNRVMSVGELLKALSAGNTEEDLFEALRSRVMDTNETVIESLYSDTQVILPILRNLTYIESVSKALAAPNVSRAVMRLHFQFIADNFYGHDLDLSSVVFERIFLPYILFTKPRQKTATLVWQTLRRSKMVNYELFAGCIDIVFPLSEAEEISRSVGEMVALNLAVTAKIAGNIVASNSYHRHLDMLLSLLGSSGAHASIAAYLLSRSLLGQLSGEHQVDAGHRILMAMQLPSMDVLHDLTDNAPNLQDVISDDALSRSIVSKPSSRRTVRRLQAAILVLLPVIPRPVGVIIDWLGDAYPESSDTRGRRFVDLARAVYFLANSVSAAQSISTSILRALFVNLREEALLLLAGIWSTGVQSDLDPENLRLVALSHGAAFLKAQSAELEHPQDFQVILPSLLIAMQSRQRSVRQAAMDCISIIVQCSSSTTVPPTIYAVDSVYGINADGLQYLEQSDFCRYVSSLHSFREHFINDSDYLGVFQQEMLRKGHGDSKKDAGYKYRVLCYILSHVVEWSSIEARTALLKTTKNVSDVAKLQMLLPLIQQLAPNNMTDQGKEERSLSWNEYCQILLEAFDEATSMELNETGNRSWSTFMHLISSMFSTDASSSIRDTILRQLRAGIFDMLTLEHQLEICVALVEVAAVYMDHYPQIKETLGHLLNKATLTTRLLIHFQPSATDSSQRATKRAKVAVQLESSAAESSLRYLTILVEILNATALPGSIELMSSAIDILTRVFHAHSAKSDVNYLMQILMSMLEVQASALANNASLPPGSVRMEVLVELLRVSDNPQTFNQALLLIASLARLSPDFVMQNVMPVFTFMGSNVFHRDDTYSFRVVQKTVESIVPVMIDSLRKKHDSSPALQIASREFLRVFTDASTHVPRHRRTQFFNHLVEVLGPAEFTVSICLLLVDKAANKVTRQRPGDVATTLSLPLAILQANFRAAPFKVVENLLREVSRILLRITEPGATVDDNIFLESHMEGENSSSTMAKRQIQAILLFVDLVLRQSSQRNITPDEKAVQQSVQILIELSDLGHGSASLSEYLDISRTALKTLGHLLCVISAMEFTSSISTIIDARAPATESGAMNLLASRLVNITPKIRQEMSLTIIRIIQHARESLKTSQELPILKADIKALSAIAKTAVNSEVRELTAAVPVILQAAARQESLTTEVLSCILALSAAIGPRILPFFRGVVTFCCDVLTQIDTIPGGQHSRTEEDAQSILVALLSSLSQFWGIDELLRLTELSLATRPVSLLLRRTLAKSIPARQLLPPLFRIWNDIATAAPDAEHSSRQEAFFDLLRRVVRNAPREDVYEHLRQTFKLFLEAFDVVGRDKAVEQSESALMAAFVEVVKKLNEATFRPLFRRLFDWAFDERAAIFPYRQVVFCRTLTALIKLLKGLLNPYMATVLVPLAEVLDSYNTTGRERERSLELWRSAIELFQTSIELDEGIFWRPDKLQKLMPTLIAQIDVCPHLPDGSARLALKACLSTFTVAVDADSLMKTLNIEVLMKTRSDDALVRVFALECARHVWQKSGNKLIGFVSDVVTFIAECADDEHDEVAKEARKLKRTVERKCGNLDMLMQ